MKVKPIKISGDSFDDFKNTLMICKRCRMEFCEDLMFEGRIFIDINTTFIIKNIITKLIICMRKFTFGKLRSYMKNIRRMKRFIF